MTQTFDIRFARSSGLLGLFEAPANTFRWKGGGRLRIDADGIVFAAGRGRLSLFPSSCRVAAASVRDVLREGRALRVEFTTGDRSRAVVSFWSASTQIAEQIARLLPTGRSVELDHDATGIARPGFRADWRMLVFVAVLGAVAAIWTLREPAVVPSLPGPIVADLPEPPRVSAAPEAARTRGAADSPTDSRPVDPRIVVTSRTRYTPVSDADELPAAADTGSRAPETESSVDAAVAPSARAQARWLPNYPATIHVTEVDGVVPIVPGMRIHEIARYQLDLFKQETAELITLARGGGASEAEWWNVMERIYNDPDFQDIDLTGLRDLELGICRAWIDYQDRYGGRGAEFALEFAERLTARADIFVR